jgi:hypothetical protein
VKKLAKKKILKVNNPISTNKTPEKPRLSTELPAPTVLAITRAYVIGFWSGMTCHLDKENPFTEPGKADAWNAGLQDGKDKRRSRFEGEPPKSQ